MSSGARLPFFGNWARKWVYHWVCEAWPVRCQTYGYLPSLRASPPLASSKLYWTWLNLVTEAHVCEQLAQGHYMKVKWPGVEVTYYVLSGTLNSTSTRSLGEIFLILTQNNKLHLYTAEQCVWWTRCCFQWYWHGFKVQNCACGGRVVVFSDIDMGSKSRTVRVVDALLFSVTLTWVQSRVATNVRSTMTMMRSSHWSARVPRQRRRSRQTARVGWHAVRPRTMLTKG